MLLLYYHQLKGESTGRITDKPTQYHKLDRLTKQKLTGRKWLNFLRIGEDKVLRILKVNEERMQHFYMLCASGDVCMVVS